MTTIDTPALAPARALPVAFSWRLALMASGVLLAYGPLLAAHGRQLWLRPHYQFFPVLLLGAAILAWQRLHSVHALRPGPRSLSYGLVGLAASLLAAAVVLDSSWLGTVSLLLLLAAALLALGGPRLFLAALPAWAVLWLLLPPPFELDRNLVLALQSFTTQQSSRLLDLLGVFHVMDGHVVEVRGRRLLVEEACTGINSLFSMLACTLLFVLLARRPWWRAALLVVAAIGWVLAANVARVVTIAYLFSRHGLDWTSGWRHEALGMGLFALALVLVWSTDRLLAFLAGMRNVPAGELPGRGTAAPIAFAPAAQPAPQGQLGSTWLGSWPIAGMFLALGVVNVQWNGPGVALGAAFQGDTVAASLSGMKDETLAARAGEWRRQKFAEESRNPGSAFGEFSKIWVYQGPRQQAIVSLDYPFPGWHDLTRCYTSQGWVIDEERVEDGDGQAPGGYVVLRLKKPGHYCGYLIFAQLDGSGKALEPRLGGAGLSLSRQEQAWRRFQCRLRGESTAQVGDPTGTVYQLQLFIESYVPLNDQERNQARDLLVQCWQRLREQWAVK